MPTYEYECENCGHKLEKFQTMSARPLRVCPECGKRSLHRLIGAGAGLIFKGSGFYETDYRSSSYKEAAAKEKNGTVSETGKTDSHASDKKSTSSSNKSTKTSDNKSAKSIK